MNGDFAQGTITFTADLPQEVIDKVLANTKEDMGKWLEAGNMFDLSDGADRTVAYISFPKGTKPEDVVRVVRCEDCIYYDQLRRACGRTDIIRSDFRLIMPNWYCADGIRRNP